MIEGIKAGTSKSGLQRNAAGLRSLVTNSLPIRIDIHKSVLLGGAVIRMGIE